MERRSFRDTFRLTAGYVFDQLTVTPPTPRILNREVPTSALVLRNDADGVATLRLTARQTH